MVKRGKKGEVKDRGREAEGEGMKEERITIIFLKYFSEKRCPWSCVKTENNPKTGI